MNDQQATDAVQNAYLLSGEKSATQDQLNYHVPRVKADPGYIVALMHSLYLGPTWQNMSYLAVHYSADTKSQYDKGFADGKASSGGTLPKGTYLQVDPTNVIEVK